MDDNVRDSIRKIVEYLWDEEERHYNEEDGPLLSDHIFYHLKEVKDWLRWTENKDIIAERRITSEDLAVFEPGEEPEELKIYKQPE